jgi:hypothetical protein
MWIGRVTASFAFLVGEWPARRFDFRTFGFAGAPDFLDPLVVEGDWQTLEGKPQQRLMQKAALRHFHWLPKGGHPQYITHRGRNPDLPVSKKPEIGSRVAPVLPALIECQGRKNRAKILNQNQ